MKNDPIERLNKLLKRELVRLQSQLDNDEDTAKQNSLIDGILMSIQELEWIYQLVNAVTASFSAFHRISTVIYAEMR